MDTNLTTILLENFHDENNENNETRVTNRVIGIQSQDPFEDPGENLGRLDDYFEFLNSKKSDEKTTCTNEE